MKNDNSKTIRRQPIVVVVGHVDHGKTTLLDYIRKTEVASKEAGGITQAIGAYEVAHAPSEAAASETQQITFIDTPGHEAFTSMRSRGARVADLAVLVVAADESIKPQTEEAILILKETKTPFVVAINKIDAPGADVDRVKNDLTAHGVLLEGFGGDVSYQAISAKSGEGVRELLDLLVLAADLEGFSYDPKAPANGFVLEARMNARRGIEATLILREGVLRKGDAIGTATTGGKVRILENFRGGAAGEIHAGQPAIVIGFDALPKAGEVFSAGGETQEKMKDALRGAPILKKDISGEAEEGDAFLLILKADDAGSVEALTEIVGAMKLERPLKVLSIGVGDVTEGDVKLAISAGAAIIGFKSKIDKAAHALAQAHGILIVTSNIVYDLVSAIEELAVKLKTGVVIGTLEVLALFNQKRLDKQLVGGKITQGVFPGKGKFHIERNSERIGVGRILSIESQKKEVPSVPAGNDAGIIVGSDQKIEVGDVFVMEKERK